MTIARHYTLQASAAKVEALRSALIVLADRVRTLDGCERVDLMQDVAETGRFVMVEHWASVDHHKASGPVLGREALADVMASLSQPPQASYMDAIASA